MRVTDLTPDHVGRRISLTGKDWHVVGVLERVDTEYDMIYEDTIQDPDPEPIRGQKWTALRVSGWEHSVTDGWDINVGMLE